MIDGGEYNHGHAVYIPYESDRKAVEVVLAALLNCPLPVPWFFHAFRFQILTVTLYILYILL